MQRMARASDDITLTQPSNLDAYKSDGKQSALRFVLNSQDTNSNNSNSAVTVSKVNLTLRTKFSDQVSDNQIDDDSTGGMVSKSQSNHSSHSKQVDETAGQGTTNVRRAVLSKRSSLKGPR